MDEYISASKYYKQDTRVQNGTRLQYQTYYKEYICVVLYQPYFENIFPFQYVIDEKIILIGI